MNDTIQLGSNLADKISEPFVLAIGTILAIALYALRQNLRLVYGLLELAVGLFLLHLGTQIHHGSFSSGFSQDFDVSRAVIKITTWIGGVFAMIRGFDSSFVGIKQCKKPSTN